MCGVIGTEEVIAGPGGPAQSLLHDRKRPSHLLNLGTLQTKNSQGAIVWSQTEL